MKSHQIELSIVMPCLDEAKTIGRCIRKAQKFLRDNHINGEIVVADNGSTDESVEIAASLGARVVFQPLKGYGHALDAAITNAQGTYIVMGDSDDSYDFSRLMPFLDKLRQGYDLVMGNRFAGKISKKSMSWINRYIGNPILSGIGRIFFNSPVGDFHCGLRGLSKNAYQKMKLSSPGMEFASEMVIRATILNQKITEVPITLHRDGRGHPSHLNPWRDGWRHLRFMLIFSPKWTLLYPGLSLFGMGSILTLATMSGDQQIGSIILGIHTMTIAAFFILIGFSIIMFYMFSKNYGIEKGYFGPDESFLKIYGSVFKLERGLVLGFIMTLAGSLLLIKSVWDWRLVGFHELDPQVTMRQVLPAGLSLALGIQIALSSFMMNVLNIKSNNRNF